MLVLDIEWLMGVCYASRDPSDPALDWPVQPDRVFSALVATWGARGCDLAERAALEWLERQEPPLLEHCGGAPRTPVTSFVPVNDKLDFSQMSGRSRQARQFPSMRLMDDSEAHLRLVWPAAASAHMPSLQDLARDTSYVGHSASMVRCRFSEEECERRADAVSAASAAPYQGRLAELEKLYERHMKGDERARPRPSQRRGEALKKQEWESPFGRDWIVLEHAGGERPDLRAIGLAAKTMRDAIMSACPDPIPEWLSGHETNGAPSAAPHLAIAPLANAGLHQYSDGRLHGLAIIPPRAIEDAWRNPAPAEWVEKQAFDKVLASLHKAQKGEEEAAIELTLGSLGIGKLRRGVTFEQKSLAPRRYSREARIWSSATPVALDRHLKEKDALKRLEEAQTIIAESCARMGLPAVRVHAYKHASITGSPSAWPPGGAPHWQNWARPASLKARPLYHATLEFASPVRGPLLLGAGRFFGLGLFLPQGGKE